MSSGHTVNAAEARWSKRRHVNLPCRAIQDGLEIPGLVTNISGGGAQIQLDSVAISALNGAPIDLDVTGIGRMPCHLAWRSAFRCGVSFDISESLRNLLEQRIRGLSQAKADEMRTEQENLLTLPPAGSSSEEDAAPDPTILERRQPRYKIDAPGALEQDKLSLICRVVDLSVGGARVRVDSAASHAIHNTPLILDLPGYGRFRGQFRWRSGLEAGLAFHLNARQTDALANKLVKLRNQPALCPPLSSAG